MMKNIYKKMILLVTFFIWIIPYLLYKNIMIFINKEFFKSIENKIRNVTVDEINNNIDDKKPELTAKRVIKVVTKYYSLPEDWVKAKRRFRNMSTARKMIATILFKYTNMKLYEIAKHLNYKNDNHSAVGIGIKKLQDLSHQEVQIRIDYQKILNDLNIDNN